MRPYTAVIEATWLTLLQKSVKIGKVWEKKHSVDIAVIQLQFMSI